MLLLAVWLLERCHPHGGTIFLFLYGYFINVFSYSLASDGCRNNSLLWSQKKLRIDHLNSIQLQIKLPNMYALVWSMIQKCRIMVSFFVKGRGKGQEREIGKVAECTKSWSMQQYWRTLILMKLIELSASLLLQLLFLITDHRFGDSFEIMIYPVHLHFLQLRNLCKQVSCVGALVMIKVWVERKYCLQLEDIGITTCLWIMPLCFWNTISL